MGLPKYILNLEEMADALQDMKISVGMTEADLTELIQLLNEKLSAIIELLRLLSGDRNLRHRDMSIHMPALPLTFQQELVLQTDALLTGITFSQSGWKTQDRISFLAGDNVIMDGIHTKELGENKVFPVGIFAPEGTKLKLQYDNISGTSKMFFCDVNFIEIRQPDQVAGKEL